MKKTFQMIFSNWVYGGSLAGIALLCLLPVLASVLPLWVILVFLQLPVYMLHQFEEHNLDRFRGFVNRTVCGGVEALSPAATFVINVPGVWGVNLAALLLAYFLNPGFGLIAFYLVLVNALAHIQQSLRLRAYNPGVVTAILLFLPVGGFCLWKFSEIVKPAIGYHVLGLGIAVVIHVGIVAWILWSLRLINSKSLSK